MTRSCPCCNEPSESETFLASANSPAETQSIENLRDYWRGFRPDSTFFTYVRCELCGFAYCSRYFTEPQLDELYSFMPDNTNNEDIDLLRKTQNAYERQIKAYGFGGSRALDVGADIGLLAEALRSRDSRVSIDAIEPNRAVHPELQSAIGPGGRIADTWAGLPDDARYDLIAGIHVIDHLVDLRGTIEQVVQRIRPGGQVYFVTHNERSLMRRLLGRRWPPFCLQHPHLFDRHTLRRIFENAGFVNVQVRRTTNYFSLRHIARVATQLLGLPTRLANIAPPVALPLKLGNISVQATWPT